MRAAPLLLAPLALAACGPIPVERAERMCFEQARLAQQPRGHIEVGAGSRRGAHLGGEVEISSDFLLGRDPAQVYDACVQQKSGRLPTRPLYSRTDWKG